MRPRLLVCAGLLATALLAPFPPAVAGDAIPRSDREGPGARGAGGAAPGGVVQRSPEFLQSVSEAIDRGVGFLRAQQRFDGGFGTHTNYPCGLTALAYHTLRTCGVPDTDPACVAAYEAMRSEYAAAKKWGELRTYTAGLLMLAIADHALAWTPDRSKRKAAPSRLADERDRTWMNELVAYLENCQATGGGWRYGEVQPYAARSARSSDFDHSNTQYAAQGLRAASLLGCDVRTETWTRLAEHLLAQQQQDGPDVRLVPKLAKGQTGAATTAKARGWGYNTMRPDRPGQPSDATGSMTAGSLASLALARDGLRGRSRLPQRLLDRCETGVRDGIGWLAQNFDVTQNPNRGGWHLYYLYALERAGDLADVEWMGEHDWYGEGATQLLRMQDASGSWREHAPEVVPTCFALLFLRRAARGLTNVTPGAAEDQIHFDVAARLTGTDFDDFVDLVVSRWRRVASERGRDELADGAASVGERIVVPLLVRMDSPDAATRRAAAELLRRITGVTHPFEPDAAPAARAEQLVAWEAWTIAAAGRLRYDRALGRLVPR